MSKRAFKSQASAGRVASGLGTFGVSALQSTHASILSYIQEVPDYSGVHNGNSVVILKNLSKRDSITKAKALEDTLAYATPTTTEIEDGLLEVWMKLYPRLSIDSSRRVRQLSHEVTGLISSKCGKRTVKYLPRIAGAWLAGTYDNDRSTAKSAEGALSTVFSNHEKFNGLLRTFHRPILEYCRDAALHESVQTLSDERTVSPDDALNTYARVVATSLAVVIGLLTNLAPAELSKQQDLYDDFLGRETLWDFITSTDTAVRRSVHRLAQVVLLKQPDHIAKSTKELSHAFVYKGSASDQSGSSADFVRTLVALTSSHPSIWTDDYTGKKPPESRLRHLLKRASQGGSIAFWEELSALFTNLPKEVLPSTYKDSTELLLSARDGVTKKDERSNASSAWSAYFTLVDLLTEKMSQEDCERTLDDFVMPLFRQYLHPSSDTVEWSVAPGKAAAIIAQTIRIKSFHPVLKREWPLLADSLIASVKLSQPQQSKDFQKSQMDVVAAGERWTQLQQDLYKSHANGENGINEQLTSTSIKVVKECTDLLLARDGKPFAAAAIIDELVRTSGQYLLSSDEFRATLQNFLRSGTSILTRSPSRQHFIQILFAARSESYFEDIFSEVLHTALNAEEATDAIRALEDIFSSDVPEKAVTIAKTNPQLQDFVGRVTGPRSDVSIMKLFSLLLRLGALPVSTSNHVLSSLAQALATDGQHDDVLDKLELLSVSNESALRSFVSKTDGTRTQLLPSLLELEDSADDAVARKAAELSARLSSVSQGAGISSRYAVLIRNLERVSQSSLPIDALYELANRVLGPDRKVADPADVLLSTAAWLPALHAVVRAPPASLALLSPLGGAVHLVNPTRSSGHGPVQIDKEGLSQALRIAMYVTRLLAETNLFDALVEHHSTQQAVFALLYMTKLLAEDNLSIIGANALWHPRSGHDLGDIALDFVTEANVVLAQYEKSKVSSDDALEPIAAEKSNSARLQPGLEILLQNELPDTAWTYYVRLAVTKVNVNLFETYGHNSEQVKSSEALLRRLRAEKDPLQIAVCLVGLQQPLAGTQILTRFCNELVAELTALKIESQEQDALTKLVLLNAILATQEEAVASIAKQRLIFLVKHLIPALAASPSMTIKAELCKALTLLLPGMQDMYGEHWAQILMFLANLWPTFESNAAEPAVPEDQILLEHASLKLVATLRKLSQSEESNDDLVDAIKAHHKEMHDGLLSLLKAANGVADESHQPLMMTHELLARDISRLPQKSLNNVDELYPLLSSPSRSVQQAAFGLLHHHIPAAQEQISFDAALENKVAHLPDELLSLILEAPTLDSLAEVSFDRNMPLQLQGYLYSWRLLFDHFSGSSYKVKNDYIGQLKEGTYLTGLLSLTFDFLGHSHGKPVDASKFDVLEYKADVEQKPEKDVQWLLTHLYYLSLTNLPSLVRSYYLDIRSRQTSQAVEKWTAKSISPLIMSTSLEAVSQWAETSVKDDPEYEKMTIKVGLKSKEINVSYEVDEQMMAIKVVLPEGYPLASAQVVGVSRVAVKEEKWQSWLRNCQGVITFSNGSITDGLFAWRKNVTGALKGQTECAICYSIISVDKQLPKKKCPTCKNLFHSSCLFKWFKTSNASTCPLCRNPFNFN